MKTNTEYNRTRLIALAGWVALYGNLALAAGKLAVGIRAQSLAVIGDGLDTAADVVIAVMTLLVSRVISRPADAGYPWGHGRAETAATVVLSFIIFLAGASLAQRAIGQFRSGALSPVPGMLPLVVTGVSIAGKYLLSLSQDFFGKKAGSSMILANGVNMRSDIIISASVLAGLLLSRVFRLPVLDPVTAFLVSLWIMKSGVAVFLEGSTELMDG
ncbi:MAG: cation diffusion facilitator family transporter, partial [Spirochaetaceae bacterium]|nr:cation diffusion facilitator family transporter [Spirochaetaceae bacterium]